MASAIPAGSPYFTVDAIRPAWIHVNTTAGMPMQPDASRDESGRAKLPAYLLTARKAAVTTHPS